jgi:outer membrane protein assembly factor BamA
LDRTEFAVSSQITWPVSKRMSLGTGFDVGMTCFQDPGEVDFCKLEEFTPQLRPSVRWRWDTQDNPLNPTRGFTIGADVRYIFGTDREFQNNNNFVKWESSVEFAVDLRFGPILAAFVRYGGSYQIGGGEDILPPNEVFTLGGSNGMRGFTDHAVGRYDQDGVLDKSITNFNNEGGGNVILNGSMELRFPLLKNIGLWGATFMDAGAVGIHHTDITEGSFRFSTGVGLRYLIGSQFPIRLDWGIVLGEPRCIEWRDDIELAARGSPESCNIMEDGHVVHFDLLYPF